MLPHLERTKQQGGIRLPQLRTYLLWQHASAFVSFVHVPEWFPGALGDHFWRWASVHGMSVTPETLAWFQLAVVPLANLPFLGSSARSFSLLRQAFLAALPSACLSSTWPAWHTVAYRDHHGHTYFSPSLIRQGIMTLQQLRALGNFPGCLPPTWDPRYRQPPSPASTAGEFSRDLVLHWGSTPTLHMLMTASSVEECVPDDTWGHFNSLRLEGPMRDFLLAAIWRKLPVGDRIAVWVPQARHCPLCGAVETHDHAVSACPFLGLAPSLITMLLSRREVGVLRERRRTWC